MLSPRFYKNEVKSRVVNMETLARFIRDDRGNAVFEYSLVSAVFFIAVIGGLSAVQTQASSQLVGTQSRLETTAVSLPTPTPTDHGH